MAWTTPATWTAGQLVTALDLNTQVRDNLNILKASISNDGGTWSGSVTSGTSGTIGYSDGYFARVGANSIKLWNGAALGTFQAGTVQDSVGTLAAVRGGAIAITSQAALDFIYGASSSALARLAAGSALQFPRINAAGNGWEFANAASGNKDICNGRLTLETGVPISVTDQAAKGTLYWTPFKGNQVGLYNGTSWDVITFTELSISLASSTASKPADVFVYNNSGTATLETLAWTSTTARATALTTQDGVYVKSGATTRRYVGTIYIDSGGNTATDTLQDPGVWNFYNQVPRPVGAADSTASWTWATPAGTYRAARNTAANAVNIIVGLAGYSQLHLTASSMAVSDAGINNGNQGTGIGIDSSTVNSAQICSSVTAPANYGNATNSFAHYEGYPAIGKRSYRWLEWATDNTGTATFTFYGAATLGHQMGIYGYMNR